MGKASVASVSTAAHARTMRKGSSDHLVLNIGSESERLIAAQDSDDKGIVAYFFYNTPPPFPPSGTFKCVNNSSVFLSLKGV